MSATQRPLVVEVLLSNHDRFDTRADVDGRPVFVRRHEKDRQIMECRYPLPLREKKRRDPLARAWAYVELVTDESRVPGGLSGCIAALVYTPSEEEPNCVLFVGAESFIAHEPTPNGLTGLEPKPLVLLAEHVVARMKVGAGAAEHLQLKPRRPERREPLPEPMAGPEGLAGSSRRDWWAD